MLFCKRISSGVGRARSSPGRVPIAYMGAQTPYGGNLALHQPGLELQPDLELDQPDLELDQPGLGIDQPDLELDQPALELYQAELSYTSPTLS